MWLGTAILAVMNFRAVERGDYFFVSAFFGCFVVVALQLLSMSYFRRFLAAMMTQIAKLNQQLGEGDQDDE